MSADGELMVAEANRGDARADLRQRGREGEDGRPEDDAVDVGPVRERVPGDLEQDAGCERRPGGGDEDHDRPEKPSCERARLLVGMRDPRCGRPGFDLGMSHCQGVPRRTWFSRATPPSQVTTIAIETGLTDPMAIDSGSSAPIVTSATTATTNSPSSTGISEPTRKVSACERDAAASQRTITIVWIAMPPIRLPAARPRFPLAAAVTVIAISGSVPATASRMTPPSASPRS